MFVLFISIHVKTLVPPCLTAGLRGLQEAPLRRAADGGRCQLGREGGRDLSELRFSASSSSALTLNTCQPACYLLQGSEGELGERSLIRGVFTASRGLSAPADRAELDLQDVKTSK